MNRREVLAKIGELMSQMDQEQLMVFRALILSSQGRTWVPVDGAAIQRLNDWLTIGETDHAGGDFRGTFDSTR